MCISHVFLHIFLCPDHIKLSLPLSLCILSLCTLKGSQGLVTGQGCKLDCWGQTFQSTPVFYGRYNAFPLYFVPLFSECQVNGHLFVPALHV